MESRTGWSSLRDGALIVADRSLRLEGILLMTLYLIIATAAWYDPHRPLITR